MRSKLSIGIPLYKSAPFYDNIVRNIEEIDYPNVEILISDRHLYDDTIELLDARFDDDARVRCFRHDDGLGWLDNYNFLLATATGDYFTWLPHDDGVPSPLADLVVCLESDPAAVLAYPLIEMVDGEGRPLGVDRYDLRVAERRRHLSGGFGDALLVAARVRHRSAARGVFRLGVVKRDGLEVPPVRGGMFATDAFRFGLACRGTFVMVPSAVVRLRLHEGNLTWRYRPTLGRWLSYFWAARRFHPGELTRPARVGRDAALFVATAMVAPSVRVLGRWTRRWRRSRAARGI